MEFLRDPIWQFIGVIVTAFFGLLPLVLFLKQQKPKEITYKVISDNFMLKIEEAKQIKGKVLVSYRGRYVNNIRLVFLKIWNSGAKAINASDFVKNTAGQYTPITLDFGNEAEVIEAEVVESVPRENLENVKKLIMWDTRKVTVNPITLLKRESFTLKIELNQLKGHTKSIKPFVRIVDLDKLNNSESKMSIAIHKSDSLRFLIRVACYLIACGSANELLNILYTMLGYDLAALSTDKNFLLGWFFLFLLISIIIIIILSKMLNKISHGQIFEFEDDETYIVEPFGVLLALVVSWMLFVSIISSIIKFIFKLSTSTSIQISTTIFVIFLVAIGLIFIIDELKA